MKISLELSDEEIAGLSDLNDKIGNDELKWDNIRWDSILIVEKILKTIADEEERLKLVTYLQQANSDVRCTCRHLSDDHALADRTGLCILAECKCEKFELQKH